MTDIKNLVTGFKRFRKSYFGQDQQLFGELKRGQSPSTLVIACSDSRVDPAIITDCEPGDLFVVRNVANLVPPYEKGMGLHGVSTALEFAVCTLKVENIIVLGHSQCGGIRALMDGATGEFIPGWMNISARAKQRVLEELPDATPEQQLCACEEESILVSLENLLTFPWLKARVDSGDLTLYGWRFDIGTGELVGYNAKSDVFETVA
ncbi:MAG TPA: carbonic anhydrase [Methylophilaceae bacterium]|jgi:carbonic anhydrase